MAAIYDPNICVFAQSRNEDGVPLCVMYRDGASLEAKTAALRVAPVHRCCGCPQSVHNLCSREYLQHHPIFSPTADGPPNEEFDETKQWCERCLRRRLARLPSDQKPPGSAQWRLPDGPPELVPMEVPRLESEQLTAAPHIPPTFSVEGRSYSDFTNFTRALKPSFRLRFDYPFRSGDPLPIQQQHEDTNHHLVYNVVDTEHLGVDLEGIVLDYDLPALEEVHPKRLSEGHMMLAHGFHCTEKIRIKTEFVECGKFKGTEQLQPRQTHIRFVLCSVCSGASRRASGASLLPD